MSEHATTTVTTKFTQLFDSIASGDLSGKITFTQKETEDHAVAIHAAQAAMDRLKDMTQQLKVVLQGGLSEQIKEHDQNDALAQSLNTMIVQLQSITLKHKEQTWVAKGLSGVINAIGGDVHVKKVASSICSYLAKYLEAQTLALYVAEGEKFSLAGSYGSNNQASLRDTIEFSQEGIGQAVARHEIISVANAPEDYLYVNFPTGDVHPRNITIIPFVANGAVVGVLGLGVFDELSDRKCALLDALKEPVGIVIQRLIERSKMNERYEEMEKQFESLQTEHENLRVANEQLIKKNKALEAQKKAIQTAKKNTETQSDDLVLSSQYKSEFLSVMSHDLRSPLNGLLLLSKALCENKKGNLDDDQIEDLQVISEGGLDLLHLINDVMDLFKAEIGKLNINLEDVKLDKFCQAFAGLCTPLTKHKGLEFTVSCDREIPNSIKTDFQRLEQILKIFLTSVLKVSERGAVQLHIHPPLLKVKFERSTLTPQNTLAFTVMNNGMAAHKQKEISETYQQRTEKHSREYGGPNLRLTLAHELAKVLGGEIHVENTQIQSSQFTLFLPANVESGMNNDTAINNMSEDAYLEDMELNQTVDNLSVLKDVEAPEKLTDETLPIHSVLQQRPLPQQQATYNLHDETKFLNQRKILLVDDDMRNIFTLSKKLQETGAVVIEADNGQSALQKMEEYDDIELIILGGMLPVMDGYETMRAIRKNPNYKTVVIVALMSKPTLEDRSKCIDAGASDCLVKPVNVEKMLAMLRHWFLKE